MHGGRSMLPSNAYFPWMPDYTPFILGPCLSIWTVLILLLCLSTVRISKIWFWYVDLTHSWAQGLRFSPKFLWYSLPYFSFSVCWFCCEHRIGYINHILESIINPLSAKQNYSRWHINFFYYHYLSVKIRFAISCKLSAWQMIHMKCQNFSLKNKNKIEIVIYCSCDWLCNSFPTSGDFCSCSFGLIWIQTVWHSDCVLERYFWKS